MIYVFLYTLIALFLHTFAFSGVRLQDVEKSISVPVKPWAYEFAVFLVTLAWPVVGVYWVAHYIRNRK